MHVRCPHCHNPIEIIDDSSLRDIPCPSCGSIFSLVADETVSFKREETKTLGHFELVEKLGVGAFGTVWKARDTELDRTVAVKVPRKDQLSEQDTEQFFREARAAAQLKHPSIVGVHEVGRDDDTVYIVSDFIDGLTLADWLTGQRPTTRESVELVAKIASALHVAHEQGIVHRDLKPSNIMLDESGEPHVMDFGLAKRDAGEITMTVDGQVIGTPAYMAPEQARGDAHTADRRADVYALGVILFELLTGEKPFRGNTRMLLHQVLNEEAPSPCKLNSNVPRDVETITLRCLEKEPGNRFSAADGLSADLQRYLNDEPVESRPVGRAERGARWCRRNPVVSSLAGCIALLLVVGISVVTVLWMTAQSNARDADTFAEKYRQEAENATDLAKKEHEARKTAEAEKERADTNLERAQNVVDEFFTEVSESGELLSGTPGTQELRSKLLEKAEKYYEAFIAENESTQMLEDLVKARLRLGKIQSVMSSYEKAEESYSKALMVQRELCAEAGEKTPSSSVLAKILNDLGNVYEKAGRLDEAIHQYQESVTISNKLIEANPDSPEHKNQLAVAVNNLGVVCKATGNFEEAIRHHNEALMVRKELIASYPGVADFKSGLATTCINLASSYYSFGKPYDAIDKLKLAIGLYEQLAEGISSHRANIAIARGNLALVYETVDEVSEAIAQYNEVIPVLKQLATENPTVPTYKNALATNFRHLGIAYRISNRTNEAIEYFKEAVLVQERLAEQFDEVPSFRHSLAMNHIALGNAYKDVRDYGNADREARLSIDVSMQLIEKYGDVPKYLFILASGWNNRGTATQYLGQLESASGHHKRAIEILKPLTVKHPKVTSYRVILGGSHVNLAGIKRLRGRFTEALEELATAFAEFRIVLDTSPRDGEARRFLANAMEEEAKARNGRAWLQATNADASLRNGRQAVADATKSCELTNWKNYAYLDTLAAAHAETRDFDEAIKFQQQAIQLAPDSSKTELQERLKLYKLEKPYREEPKSTDAKQNRPD